MTAINPVLYQLYMIPSFRKGILSLSEAQFENTDKTNSLPYQLKKVFEEYDLDKLPDIKGFCYAFKDFEGKPTNPLTPIDAAEFMNILFDKLDSALQLTDQNDIINKPFRGKLLNELLYKDCSHNKGRAEDFYTISLPVKHIKDLEHGMADFVQGELLDGENQLTCDQCQKKGDVLKRTCLAEVPDHLCFTLKRFELDFDTFENVLISDYFELPDVINMRPYTHEGLAEGEEEKSSQGKYRYRMSGAVIYKGTSLTSGNYYSLVKDREDNEIWYKMGVKGKEKFDPKDFAQEAFGQKESEKSNGLAYMVFYDKIDSIEDHLYEREP